MAMRTDKRTSVWRSALLFPVGFVLAAGFIIGIMGTSVGVVLLVWHRGPAESVIALVGRTVVYAAGAGSALGTLRWIWPER
jgi:hypothetical protein